MKTNVRCNLLQLSNILLAISSAFMFWKTLSVVANSPSPIVVVLSGSMEPAFQRGDILFLWNRDKYVDVGDIVVYNMDHRDIPIVHRVLREHKVIPTDEEIEKFNKKQGLKKDKNSNLKIPKNKKIKELKPSQKILTKGDNNPSDDLPLYGYKQMYIDRDNDLIGSVKGYIPLAGYVTILISENIYFKYILIGLICLSSLFSNE
ncbi:hypothetical protein PACTADRAFT_4062 [Pachysolen tannophilus NRRL Y-2460]|uniref:Signal peptidase complex catalytic subunit SEC11 n=1 Tax=Pachysolen tannophilus NRRL Y-2460 TaxID=669874 RepID=A0A1E4TQT3_PACTA|nr:hypothetical protein PACTADRAFT_4062 [Pachysolen tannophilus NRRL Y-2460]